MRKEIMGYYEISNKERMFFAVRLIISILLYLLIFLGIFAFFAFAGQGQKSIIYGPVFTLAVLFFIIFLSYGRFSGQIKAFGVKINEKQFPEIHLIVKQISEGLEIRKMPEVYLWQAGGSLNAFAYKFLGSNFVVIYSDLLEAYYQDDKDAVEFVIAHELGHIKREHFLKKMLLLPSALIPFLSSAYSRGCELTCDNIGNFFNPRGSVNGLKLLAGGKVLYKSLNEKEYMMQNYTDGGFWRFYAEICSTHPALYERIINVTGSEYYKPAHIKSQSPQIPKVENNLSPIPSVVQSADMEEVKPKKEDYSRFMPR